MGCIYLITNKINNKQYVGQTTKTVESRLSEHFSLVGKPKSCVSKAVRKYGKENFEVSILMEENNIDKLNELEIDLIQKFNTLVPNGYNYQPGGKNRKCNQETKEKISKTKKGKPNNYLKGVPKTDQHKQKLREAKLGKKQTSQHAKNAAEARIGKKLKPIIAINLETKEEIFFNGIKFVTERGFNKNCVHRVLNGEYKKHKGFSFKYINQEVQVNG